MPRHALAMVRTLATDPTRRELTGTVERDIDALGLTREQVFAVIARLVVSDFYKTMPSDKVKGEMLDVYHPTMTLPDGRGQLAIYCKVKVVAGKPTLVVLSFKELSLAHGYIKHANVPGVRGR